MIEKLIIAHSGFSRPKVFTNVQATTLDELRKELPDVDLSDDKSIVERDSKATLERGESRLPNQETVVLYVSQKKSKAGSDELEDLSRTELFEICKSLRDKSTEGAEYFKRYSNTSTPDLRIMLRNWADMHPQESNATEGDFKTLALSKVDELRTIIVNSPKTFTQKDFNDLLLDEVQKEFTSL